MQETIKQEDVDFHQCYGDTHLLNDLKEKMKSKLYPPRFEVIIQAKDQQFFQTSKFIKVNLVCNTERKTKTLKVPGVGKYNLFIFLIGKYMPIPIRRVYLEHLY